MHARTCGPSLGETSRSAGGAGSRGQAIQLCASVQHARLSFAPGVDMAEGGARPVRAGGDDGLAKEAFASVAMSELFYA